ncbi:MAG TPA: OsmC family protein [Thermoanaerobaculia bacterium]|nr:OsmC family protein [Thermoanaerobaculia bacterium]
MTATLAPPRIRPKPFTYHTNLNDVKGRMATLFSEGKPPLTVSSPPEFKGVPGIWTPEDFFVAAIEVCLMLTFVGLAEKRGLAFAGYESAAEGLLEWNEKSYQFTRVVVSPVITLPDEASFAAAGEVIEKAHATCLVANSVSCEVLVKPVFRVG